MTKCVSKFCTFTNYQLWNGTEAGTGEMERKHKSVPFTEYSIYSDFWSLKFPKNSLLDLLLIQNHSSSIILLTVTPLRMWRNVSQNFVLLPITNCEMELKLELEKWNVSINLFHLQNILFTVISGALNFPKIHHRSKSIPHVAKYSQNVLEKISCLFSFQEKEAAEFSEFYYHFHADEINHGRRYQRI